jgi:hypothetical protein
VPTSQPPTPGPHTTTEYHYGDRVRLVSPGIPRSLWLLGSLVGKAQGRPDYVMAVWDDRQGQALPVRVATIVHAEPNAAPAVHHVRVRFVGARVERNVTAPVSPHGGTPRPTRQRGIITGWGDSMNRALVLWDGAREPELCQEDMYRVADADYVAECRRRRRHAIGDRVERNYFGEIVAGLVLDTDEPPAPFGPRARVLWDNEDRPRWMPANDASPQGRPAVVRAYADLMRSGMPGESAWQQASLLWRA